jgi:xanthine/uracil permease
MTLIQDYASLFIPNVPFLVKKRELPFYGVNDKLPYMLMTILGLQQCVTRVPGYAIRVLTCPSALAMVGGLITPPLLLAGPAGANLGSEAQQYLVSASLIWCALGTTVQISRFRLFRTKYYLGTGLISVTGTSFAFTNVALSYLSQSYSNGTCPISADGKTRLPCPDEFGAILGTATLTGIYAIALAFVPPKTIRKLFPPLITGTMLLFIGAALVQSGITNWASVISVTTPPSHIPLTRRTVAALAAARLTTPSSALDRTHNTGAPARTLVLASLHSLSLYSCEVPIDEIFHRH